MSALNLTRLANGDSVHPTGLAAAPPIPDVVAAVKKIGLHDASTLQETHSPATWPAICRRLGDTEVSYYLPSRENGVNDMYLMLGLKASPKAMSTARVKAVWAILRCRHPLLASKIEMDNYDDIFFEYSPPRTPIVALIDANTTLEYRLQSSSELLNSYLNGPRTLSDTRLSYLIVSSPSQLLDDSDVEINIDLLICATHFLGDGMALHQFAHEFLSLLGNHDEAGLLTILEGEVNILTEKFSGQVHTGLCMPLSLEERLPASPPSRFYAAAVLVDHLRDQRRQIGGHAFPKKKSPDRRTIVPTVSYNGDRTKAILRTCKENGVSISSAIFALCNIAWARTHNRGWESPMMMYSALNIRPHLEVNERLNNSYFFLAIGFFNIVLPSFVPAGSKESKIFWHRARSVKTQTAKIAKNSCLISRSKEMSKERGLRARIWGMQDDGVECTLSPPRRTLFDGETRASSAALIGLSMLGNLDGIYKHPSFPTLKLHTLTTGSRQRNGGMLLFGYTFVGKLWLSLGYDVNGFDDDVVQTFWRNLLACVDDFL